MIFGLVMGSSDGAVENLRIQSNTPGLAKGEYDWTQPKRLTLGLTQTCRQFRSETLPLGYPGPFNTRATARFTAGFKAPLGNILVGRTLVVPFEIFVPAANRAVDIMELGLLARKAPNNNFRFVFESGRFETILAVLINQLVLARFRLPIASVVISMLKYRIALLTIRVQDAARRQPWMPWQGRLDGSEPTGLRVWLSQIGLGRINFGSCIFNIA